MVFWKRSSALAQNSDRCRYIKVEQHLGLRKIETNEYEDKLVDPARISNYISTAKYTVWNFIPKQLFEQFKKKANFYFLFIAVLSFIEIISPRSPLTSTTPLVVILSVSAIKEGYEDWLRHKEDKVVNSSLVWVYGEVDGKMRFKEKKTRDIKVGDIVKTNKGDFFPADLLLLKSDKKDGSAFVETANLDGEINLKTREAPTVLAKIPLRASSKDEEEDAVDRWPLEFACVIESVQPSPNMDEDDGWNGAIRCLNMNKEQKERDDEKEINDEIQLHFNHLLLRGCRLRNTEWTIGAVIFVGEETKIRQNSIKEKFKRSNVDRIVDKMLYFIFIIQMMLCSFCAAVYKFWLDENRDTWYLGFEYGNHSNITYGIINFFTFLILIDILVPVSLWVSLDFVKFVQSWLITQDINMYSEEKDRPAQARTSNLNEELGQVDYVFTDKTGTLTQNRMEFLRCFICGATKEISGKFYGPGCMLEDNEVRPFEKGWSGIPAVEKDDFRFEDNRIVYQLKYWRENNRAKMIDQFLSCIALCHSVNPQDLGERVEYQSSSPDEKALLEGALQLQYYVCKRTPLEMWDAFQLTKGSTLEVNFCGAPYKFKIIAEMYFNSRRKCMSVIVKDPRRGGRYKLFWKGADSVVEKKLSPTSLEEDWEDVKTALNQFANQGLRTLCIATRDLTEDDVRSYLKERLKIIENTTSKRTGTDFKDRKKKLEECFETVEKNLTIVGCTAIEDKLQEGVEDTIAKLHLANVKCWMLTGDKLETARMIGITCSLITPDMIEKVEIFDPKRAKNSGEEFDLKKKVEDLIKRIQIKLNEETSTIRQYKQALVMSGKALEMVFPSEEKKDPTKQEKKEKENVKKLVYQLCELCNAVICCRISAKQKAQILQLVREYNKDAITLAIGDGANDVPMIKAAHVGIGIDGLEGKQAVMNSDYAIAEFKFLQNLLFVHGAWSYRRVSILILFSFYKSVAFSLCQVWFGLSSGWSGQPYYDPWTASFFNFLFTGLPIIVISLLNRDYTYEEAIQYPPLYRDGQEDRTFNVALFVGYFGEGIMHSFLFYVITNNAMPDIMEGNQAVDLWIVSTTTYAACFYVCTLKLCILTKTWTYLIVLMFLLQIGAWFLYLYVYCKMYFIAPNMYGIAEKLYSSLHHWLIVFIICCATMIPELSLEFVRKEYWPSRVELLKYYKESAKNREEIREKRRRGQQE